MDVNDHVTVLTGSLFSSLGNGHIGLAVKRDGGLLLKEKRALSLKVPYYPYVGTDIEGHQSKGRTTCDLS